MALRNFEVINHPVRMRLYQLLHRNQLSITQLAQLLPDVPQSSIYRHIHRMLEAGVIRVADTRWVKGILERFYTATSELIDPQELYQPGGLEKFADHVCLYGSVVAQELARYILEQGKPDLENIAVRDHIFYASEEEFIQAREAIYALLQRLEQNPPAPGRVARRLFVMGHPHEHHTPPAEEAG